MENPTSEFASNYWLIYIQIEPEVKGYTREDLQMAMEAANIESRPLWKPMHLQPVFAGTPFYGDCITEQMFASGLYLPFRQMLTKDDLERVIEVFLKIH
jgi:dTDP-4-amino-4,6-dideoxygalactose transaminase